MERIKVVNVSKSFQSRLIFSHVDLSFKPGEIVGLTGINGVGKSTFIKLLCGLISPDTGQIFINGFDSSTNRKDWMKGIGALLEGSRSLYWKLSAMQNYIYFSGLKNVFGNEAYSNAETNLRFFDLWNVRNDKVETFSLGMKQRLALACSASHFPTIVLLDEPTSGLDAKSSQLLEEYVQMLAHENRTIILASHDHQMIGRLATKRLIIENCVVKSVD